MLIQSDYFNNDQAEAKYVTIPSDLLLKDIQTSSGESYNTAISLEITFICFSCRNQCAK